MSDAAPQDGPPPGGLLELALSGLLAQAGFRLDRVIPTATPASIVEATPTPS